MIRSRSRGLYNLHALIILFVLPTFFVFAASWAVVFFERYTHDFINYPLYLVGIIASGLVYFSFYQSLPTFSGKISMVQVLRITNYEVLVLAFVLFGIVFATKDKAISRSFLGFYIVASGFILLVANMYLPRLLSLLLFRGRSLRKCLLVGSRESLSSLESWVLGGSILGLDIVGALNGKGVEGEVVSGVPFLGASSDLEVTIRTHRVNQVVLLETRNDPQWVHGIHDVCEKEGCQLLVYNPWSDYFDQALIPLTSGVHTFFALQDEPLESPLNRLLKRLLDYGVAIPAVIFVLLPLALVVRIFHKKQSPGPLFHTQLRSGLNRDAFKIYKFRSMHEGEAGSPFPFGAFMRRHSLDEIPQFLNVLRGDMSVIGPRPHMLEHDDLFGEFSRIYKYRHFVRPGVTGLAQVSGLRGEISDRERIKERIILDLKYMYGWSLSLDFIIILKTIFQIFKPPPTAG